MPSAVYEKLERMFGEHRLPLSLTQMMCTGASALSALSVNMSSRIHDRARDDSKDIVYDAYMDYFRRDPDTGVLADMAVRGTASSGDAVITDLDAYRRLLEDPFQTSISALETYAACPFSFFAEYVLRLREQRDDGVGSADTGNVVHTVIERFCRSLLDGETDISSLTDEGLADISRKMTDEVIEGYRGSIYALLSSGPFWREKLSFTAGGAIREIVSQMKRSDFLISAAEAEFGKGRQLPPIILDTPEGTVVLRGKIDRIDTCSIGGREYVRIIDYKTGSTVFDLTRIYYGLSLQLPIYLRALTGDSDREPAGMFYLRLSPPMSRVDGEGDIPKAMDRVRDHFRLNGLVLSDLEVIGAMDRDYALSSVLSAVNTDRKTGGLREHEQLQDREFFTRIMDHSVMRAREFSEAILNGKIPVSPVMEGSVSRPYTPCSYCSYGSLCGHSGEMRDFRKITKKGVSDI